MEKSDQTVPLELRLRIAYRHRRGASAAQNLLGFETFDFLPLDTSGTLLVINHFNLTCAAVIPQTGLSLRKDPVAQVWGVATARLDCFPAGAERPRLSADRL